MRADELGDSGKNPLIDRFLGLAPRRQLALCHHQGMIPTFDYLKIVRRGHCRARFGEQIKRTKWIPRSLDEEDRRA